MKNQAGFTLIEVIIAMLIMGVGLLGLMGISTVTLRAATDNERWNMARMIATSHAEQLSSQPLATLHGLPSAGNVIEKHNGAPFTVKWWLVKTGSVSEPILISVEVKYSDTPLQAPVTISTLRSFTL